MKAKTYISQGFAKPTTHNLFIALWVTIALLTLCNTFVVPEIAHAAGKTTITISGTCDYAQAKQVYEQVNTQRIKAGKNKLAIDKNLEATAMQRAAECALYYSHTRPDDTTCWTAFPSSYKRTIAENIASGQRNASAVMTSWMNSAGHKANILNPELKSIGVGAFTVNNTTYWVQVFSSVKATSFSWQASKTASYKVSVSNTNIGNISLSPSLATTLAVGKTLQLRTIMSNKGWSWASVPVSPTYSSGNKKIATVTNSGLVKAVGSGKTTITAKLGSKTASITITVPAQTTKVITTSITYVRNTSSNDNTSTTKTYSVGKAGQKLLSPNWTRKGYTFVGWNTSRTGSSVSYKANYIINDAWVKNNSPKKTYYAIWKANTYSIKFSANGGKGSMSSIQATYNTARTLPANTLTRSGYIFNGWNTRADGKGTAYANKASVKNLATSSTVTLYAQWKKKPSVLTTGNNAGSDAPKQTDNSGYYPERTGSVVYHLNNYWDPTCRYFGLYVGSAHKVRKDADWAEHDNRQFLNWNTSPDGTGKIYKPGQIIHIGSTELILYAQWGPSLG